MYMVKFVGGGAIDQSLIMTWNEVGILSSTTATVTNRTGDVLISALKLAAGISARTFSDRTVDTAVPSCEQPSRNDHWVLPLLELSSTAADRLKANYCAIDTAIRQQWNQRRDEDLLKQAVAAYVERVNPLITARTTILKGNSDSEEPATLLSHIEAEINEQLIVLYLGRTKTLTWDGALDVRGIPDRPPIQPIPILAVNPTKGICLLPGAELAPTSKPIPWSPPSREQRNTFLQLQTAECKDATVVNMTLQLYPEANKQLFTKIRDVQVGDRSFRYRLAAQVKATLSDAKDTYGTGVFSVSQLGRIISLPARRSSKSITYELDFIESTGALKRFKLDSVGILDTASIDALSGAGGTLLDANKKKTEADILTEQLQLLKLKDDICTIQKKYNLPCTVEPK